MQISTTPPRRRRQYWFRKQWSTIDFNHASAKEATDRAYIRHTLSDFQSTPPRRRRRVQVTAGVCRYPIHAPPRRRRLSPLLLLQYSYFNPRLREGGDLRAENSNDSTKFSIHASAKRRGDLSALLIAFSRSAIFESTPPRRRRLVLFALLKLCLVHFNPRPRRRRQVYRNGKRPEGIFQPRPRRRRIITNVKNESSCNFNPRPPRRRRRRCIYKTSLDSISIHASRRRRQKTIRSVYNLHLFQSTLREGGDRQRGSTYSDPIHFNPRLREGGD